jgi:hypothetical protein
VHRRFHADDKFFIEAGIRQNKGNMVYARDAGRICQGVMHDVRCRVSRLIGARAIAAQRR